MNTYMKLMLGLASYAGDLEIPEPQKYICPTCKKEHHDSRGFCSADCFKEMKERQKVKR